MPRRTAMTGTMIDRIGWAIAAADPAGQRRTGLAQEQLAELQASASNT